MRLPFVRMIILLGMIVLFTSPVWGVMTCGVGISPALIRLSGPTNAHVCNPSDLGCALYSTPIGCNDGAVTVSPNAAGQTLVRLSTSTNAHAQEPNYSGPGAVYTQLIKVSDSGVGNLLIGTDTDPNCVNLNGGGITYAPFLRISGSTNAHACLPSNPGCTYPNVICLAYDATGTLPQPDIVNLALGSATVSQGQVAATQATTTNEVAGNGQYVDIATLQLVGICDPASAVTNPITGLDCGELNDYTALRVEFDNFILNPAYAGPLMSGSVQITKYGSNAAYDILYTNFTTNWPSNNANTIASVDILTSASPAHNVIYSFDTGTLALVPGTYNIVGVDYSARFTFNSVTGQREMSMSGNDNMGALTVTQGGPGIPVGAAGDVYVLKELVVPNTFRSGIVAAEVTIENRNTALPQSENVNITILIRDSKGAKVSGFDPAIVPAILTGTTTVVTIPLQPPCGATTGTVCTFDEGETYSMYATVQPYVDGTPVPVDRSETFTANNNGFKTLTTLEPPQTLSIPDFPAWMSVLVLSIVLGWLFFSARKKEESN